MNFREPGNNLIGQTLDDTYRVVSELGAGGMGTLYVAEHLQLHQSVALKFIRRHGKNSAGAVLRLRQEARALALLKHPNIVQVKGFKVNDQGDSFLAMELLQGQDLAQHIKEHGPLSLEQAKLIFSQVCDALGYAHAEGVLHRDIKPANIMLLQQSDQSFRVKVLDFGLAKFADSTEGQKLTKTGVAIGSLNYMSPEQCTGEKVDERSDIYSLACTMYEALTGLVPFAADSPMSTMYLHAQETLPPLAGQPLQAVSSVLQHCTAPNPDDRMSSVDEMKEALSAGQVVAFRRKRSTRRWAPAGAIVSGLMATAVCAVLAAIRMLPPQQSSRSVENAPSPTLNEMLKQSTMRTFKRDEQQLLRECRDDPEQGKRLIESCMATALTSKNADERALAKQLLYDFSQPTIEQLRRRKRSTVHLTEIVASMMYKTPDQYRIGAQWAEELAYDQDRVRDEPQSLGALSDLVQANLDLGLYHGARNELPKAEAYWHTATDLVLPLVHVADWQVQSLQQFFLAQKGIADTRCRAGDFRGGLAACHTWEKETRSIPTVLPHQRAGMLLAKGDSLFGLGQTKAAVAAWNAGLKAAETELQHVAEAGPQDAQSQSQSQSLYRKLLQMESDQCKSRLFSHK